MAERLDVLLPDVLPHVPGCPRDQALHEIREAARTLCRRSGIWAAELDPVTVVRGVSEYELLPPDDARVLVIKSLNYNGRLLTGYTAAQLNARRPNWPTARGEPTAYVHEDSAQSFRLVPIPVVTRALAVTELWVALQPSRDAETLPELVVDEYGKAVAAGALAQLLNNHQASWYAPDQVQRHGAHFASRVADARAQAIRGYGGAEVRVRPRGHRFVPPRRFV